MLSLKTYAPSPLSPYIKSFWCMQVDDANGEPYEEAIVPDGHHEIIFHLEQGMAKRKTEQHKWLCEPVAFMAGQTLKSYSLQLGPGSRLYGIRFFPHTLSLLFGIPASLATDTIIPVEAVPEMRLLSRCIGDNVQKTFLAFESVLLKKVRSLHSPHAGFAYVDHAVSHILKSSGAVKVDVLIEKSGISGKYLDTLFQRFVGVNPKTFSSIIKLNYFLDYKKRNPACNFAQCACEAAFYDQSHLVKFFKQVTGQTPKQYFNKPHFINEQFVAL